MTSRLLIALAAIAAAGVAVVACGRGEEGEPTAGALPNTPAARAVARALGVRPAPTAVPQVLAPASALPTPTPEWASVARRLPADQLAGQLVIANLRDARARVAVSLVRAIRAGHVGGVILFADHAISSTEMRRTAEQLQALPRPQALRRFPLIVAVDQEGGAVRRLMDAPPARSGERLGRLSPAAVGRIGVATGRALVAAGVTVNLAPVTDVARRGSFLDIQDRSLGRTAAAAGARAEAFARGLQDGGVAATLKHFPGLGRARRTTDRTPVVLRDERALEREVSAFRRALAARPGLLMLASATYPALDDRPAVLSPAIASVLVRDRLGFGGATISDDLDAPALAAHADAGELAVRAVAAGTDLVLFATHARTYAHAQLALRDALRSRRLPRRRAEAAVARALALRSGPASSTPLRSRAIAGPLRPGGSQSTPLVHGQVESALSTDVLEARTTGEWQGGSAAAASPSRCT